MTGWLIAVLTIVLGGPLALPPPSTLTAGIRFISISMGTVNHPAEASVRQSRAVASSPANRLTFLQPEVHLLVECSASGDGLAFIIDGFRNPELEFSDGAHVFFEIVNLGASIPQSFVVTGIAPPYRANSIPRGPWDKLWRFEGRKRSLPLPPRTSDTVYTVEIEYQFTRPGRAYYANVYQERAQAGQWGRILVVP
jgi:hypothetical protein